MLGQAGPEDIGDVYELGSLTDRTVARGGRTHFAGRTHQLGMGIAHFAAIEYSAPVVGQHRCPRQPIVDMAVGVRPGGWRYTEHVFDRR